MGLVQLAHGHGYLLARVAELELAYSSICQTQQSDNMFSGKRRFLYMFCDQQSAVMLQVKVVINYMPPIKITRGIASGDPIAYVHQTGRCGRFYTNGLALTLMLDSQRHHSCTEQSNFRAICMDLELTVSRLPDLPNEASLLEMCERAGVVDPAV